MIVLTGLGVFIIAYSLVRQFTGFGLSEANSKTMIDIVIFAALGIFVYNRKLAKDEQQAKKAAEEAEQRAAEEHEENNTEENEDLPHWERYKDDNQNIED